MSIDQCQLIKLFSLENSKTSVKIFRLQLKQNYILEAFVLILLY